MGNHHALLIYSFVNGVTYLVAWLLIDARRPAAKRRWLPRKINGSFYCMTFSMFFSNWGYLVSGFCPVGRVLRCREGLVLSGGLVKLTFYLKTPYFFITTFTKATVPSLDENSLLPAVPLIVMSACSAYLFRCACLIS